MVSFWKHSGAGAGNAGPPCLTTIVPPSLEASQSPVVFLDRQVTMVEEAGNLLGFVWRWRMRPERGWLHRPLCPAWGGHIQGLGASRLP